VHLITALVLLTAALRIIAILAMATWLREGSVLVTIETIGYGYHEKKRY